MKIRIVSPILAAMAVSVASVSFAQTNTFPSSGSVGIGTLTPTDTLDVNGRIRFSGSDPYLRINNDTKHLVLSGGSGWTNTGAVIFLAGAQRTYGPSTINFYTGNASAMYITATRRVGVGTTSPDSGHKIHVKGSVLSEVGALSGGTQRNSGFNVWSDEAFGLELHRDATVNKWGTALYARSDSDIRIGHYGSGATAQSSFSSKMTITNGGNVGIGTASPGNKLEVNGSIRAKEVIVESTGWPDYVFEDGYSLPTLEEVEFHIEEKGHLPGVASAEEINSKGQSLGETQRLMMQKIEELTLYVLELKNENEKQQEEIERLKESKADS